MLPTQRAEIHYALLVAVALSGDQEFKVEPFSVVSPV